MHQEHPPAPASEVENADADCLRAADHKERDRGLRRRAGGPVGVRDKASSSCPVDVDRADVVSAQEYDRLAIRGPARPVVLAAGEPPQPASVAVHHEQPAGTEVLGEPDEDDLRSIRRPVEAAVRELGQPRRGRSAVGDVDLVLPAARPRERDPRAESTKTPMPRLASPASRPCLPESVHHALAGWTPAAPKAK